MISKLELENFTVFGEKVSIDFSPKINLIIGENGTGKTQLLKACYSILKSVSKTGNDLQQLGDTLRNELVDDYRPLEKRLGKLVTNGKVGGTSAEMHARIGLPPIDKPLQATFTSRSQKIAIEANEGLPAVSAPVFIPTKEVLSLVYGLSHEAADRATLERLFDGTYFDLCEKLRKEPEGSVAERIERNPRMGSSYTKLTNLICGEFSFNQGVLEFRAGIIDEEAKKTTRLKREAQTATDTIRFIPDKANPISGNMAAEGIRKLGILQRLLANGEIGIDSASTLFWDEPESNLNPKLMNLLVKILIDLADNGQQIIISTHDYVMLKCFDQLKNVGKDAIKYHCVYKAENTNNISVKSFSNLSDITPNSIDEAFGALIDEEIASQMGGLGR